ncbi:uncharacterized protein LOC113155358 isoform X2 [Anabas testudineus]|uniref:uncharacterized protein LOC113155358 isoform X2 n=1 Tax=Anabas testudineus TaxID=64144 RepID=UPI000E45978E|nr:uncharacterized protein LOC113155358 isoform X2 [Anabas testudineus]
MKGSLLLILSLLTGCEVSSKTSACKEGWAEFDCTYDKVHCRQNLPLKGKDKYQGNYGRSSPQNNKKKNNLNKCEGSQKNLCKNFQGSNSKKPQLDFVVDTCPDAFHQAAYRYSKTTITCDYPGNIHSGGFFCKQNNCCCEDILSTKLSQKSNETFTLINTSSGFNISISNVSSHDAGVYWCGVKLKENNYTALRKIQLNVTDIIKFTRSVTTGQSFSYWCNYKKCINAASTTIFICKGEDPSICQTVVTTNSINNGRFSIKDEQKNTNITITLRDVRADDAGTYWCGAKSTDNRHSNLFCNRFLMTVVTPTPPTSTQSTTSSAGLGDSLVVTIVSACVAVMLLLFVLISILLYKRISQSKNTRNGSAAQIREDYIYEEIQENFQNTNSGNATTTIYATANFPTDQSDSLCYSTVQFPKSSDKAEALLPKPSSSICDYVTVKYTVSPTYSTVGQLSSSAQPLYSTVNQPQQQ